MSIEDEIMDKLSEIIETVPGITTVEQENIKVTIADIRDHELPYVQLIDDTQLINHEQGRIRVEWTIYMELIMKSTQQGIVNQQILRNLRRDIMLALFQNPNIGIPSVISLKYISNQTDLHVIDEPYFIARAEFVVEYYDNLTGSC